MHVEISAKIGSWSAKEGPLNFRNLKREVRLIATCSNIRLRSLDNKRSTFQSHG